MSDEQRRAAPLLTSVVQATRSGADVKLVPVGTVHRGPSAPVFHAFGEWCLCPSPGEVRTIYVIEPG